jgi:hypothetical protein
MGCDLRLRHHLLLVFVRPTVVSKSVASTANFSSVARSKNAWGMLFFEQPVDYSLGPQGLSILRGWRFEDIEVFGRELGIDRLSGPSKVIHSATRIT